ncbi:hypothetical protein [Labrys sp. WJW]|uniref:hypothetical protein n=1 Tax=Labrys sp. WJW TaxID=1737983 RepID=UPI0012EAE9E3|nr:hypothetical protein [Labrys sp. WJW]
MTIDVIEVIVSSEPEVVVVEVPGPPGPAGKDGDTVLDDLPDLTLIFNNGIV